MLLLIPIGYFLWHDNLILVAILVVISFFTDFLDGMLARKLDQISEVGKVLDPLADKLSIGVCLIILYFKAIVPGWLVIIVVGRDVAIMIGGLIFASKYRLVIPSDAIGKMTANVLALMVFGYIFQLKILITVFTPLAIVFVIWSSFNYSRRFYQKIKLNTSAEK